MTLFDPDDRQEIAARVQQLTPQSQRRWGKMPINKMLCHTGDQLRMALGEIPSHVRPGPLTLPGLKQAAIYVMPWPKGKIQTAPEMLTTDPAGFEADREALLALIERFAERGAGADWAPHPLFGNLSGRAWGTLAARHLDHHLRQFGV